MTCVRVVRQLKQGTCACLPVHVSELLIREQTLLLQAGHNHSTDHNGSSSGSHSTAAVGSSGGVNSSQRGTGAATDDGDSCVVYSWGQGASGALGHGHTKVESA